MPNLSSVEKCFKDISIQPDTIAEVEKVLGQYQLSNLGYDTDFGLNLGYIFRGEIEWPTPLQTGIERAVLKNDLVQTRDLRNYERETTENFVNDTQGRVARLLDPIHSSNPEDVFWWLSWMQHYGSDTRFLDFSRDIRFALYFALEHYFNHEKGNSTKDLFIYCFPCQNLKFPKDDVNNKNPFAFNGKPIDMNLALGCEIKLRWMEVHQGCYGTDYTSNRLKQYFGWDRPHYENPRLNMQRGMFVYPFLYPLEDLRVGESWFLRNLASKVNGNEPYKYATNGLHAVRIRISHRLAKDLKEMVEKKYGLLDEVVYLKTKSM